MVLNLIFFIEKTPKLIFLLKLSILIRNTRFRIPPSPPHTATPFTSNMSFSLAAQAAKAASPEEYHRIYTHHNVFAAAASRARSIKATAVAKQYHEKYTIAVTALKDAAVAAKAASDAMYASHDDSQATGYLAVAAALNAAADDATPPSPPLSRRRVLNR